MNYKNELGYVPLPIKINQTTVNIHVQAKAITGFWADPTNSDQSIAYFTGIGQFTVLMSLDSLKNLIMVPKGGT